MSNKKPETIGSLLTEEDYFEPTIEESIMASGLHRQVNEPDENDMP